MTPLQRAQRVEELDRAAPKGPWWAGRGMEEHDQEDMYYGPETVLRKYVDDSGVERSRVVLQLNGNFPGEWRPASAFIAETRTLATALAADVVALTDLLRDAFPMFSHVPLLRDRAVALGLMERKEQSDVT